MTETVGWNRRQALRYLAASGVGAYSALHSGVPLLAQIGGVVPVPPPRDSKYPTPSAWKAEVRELAPGVFAFLQAGGPGADNASVSNAGFVVGDDGVMVIDTLTAPLHTKALIAAIRKVTDKPFRHVVITHSHPDHYYGNQYFEGAEIISHPYVRDEILREIRAGGPALWPKRAGWAEGTEPRKIVPPTTTFEGKMTYHYGNTVVELLQIVPAHTYGDTIVYLPQHGVLWLGDIAFFNVAPWLQNAHPTQWIETCRTLESMYVQAIVPGHGPLGGKAELAEMRGYLELLKAESRKRFDAGMTAGAAAADIHLGKYDNWVGTERIVMGVERFYLEFRGQLTADADVDGIVKATEEYNAIRKSAGK
jgi:cyclase